MKLICLSVPFKSKLFIKPCTKLPQIFKFRFKFKKPICIRALRFHPHRDRRPNIKTQKKHQKHRIPGFFSIFRPKKPTSSTSSGRGLFSIFRRRSLGRRTSLVEAEEVELKSMTADQVAAAGAQEKKIFPSPLTPAYVRLIGSDKKKVGGDDQDDVEDACRSFENYLVEMIVEEGKLADLMDVEELMYCWKNLKCPVFKDMVCRFYGELCKDLFSSVDVDDEEEEDAIDDCHFK